MTNVALGLYISAAIVEAAGLIWAFVTLINFSPSDRGIVQVKVPDGLQKYGPIVVLVAGVAVGLAANLVSLYR